MDRPEYNHHHQCTGKLRRGPSSLRMHDPEVVFDQLSLKPGDLGCGPGEYTIHAARLVGDSGVVYALEKWAYMIDGLTQEAAAQGLANLKPMTADITQPLSIKDKSIDVCLLSTVLHIFDLSKIEKTLFNEIRRVLKPDGRVAVIECKKEDQPFGPPKHMRLSAEDLEASFVRYGFEKIRLTDLGFNYMVQFRIVKMSTHSPPYVTCHPASTSPKA